MKINIESNIIKNIFKNVYFINGSAYAGKSTMVKLLADKYDGIFCGENYHNALMNVIDNEHQPNLSYIRNMKDWQEFISRTPEEYNTWIKGCTKEAVDLELIILLQHAKTGKKVFVDTNIPTSLLKEISDYNHVLIMLAPIETSVKRFFERPDKDKQFIYQQLLLAKEVDKAMTNYQKCLEIINSQENYQKFLNSGFYIINRNEERTIEETLLLVENHFRLL